MPRLPHQYDTKCTECCCQSHLQSKKHDHVTGLLKELHWLAAPKCINLKILLLPYKALYDEGPPYLVLAHSKKIPLFFKWNTFGHSQIPFKIIWKPYLWSCSIMYTECLTSNNVASIKFKQWSSSTVSFKQKRKTHLVKDAYKCQGWWFVLYWL